MTLEQRALERLTTELWNPGDVVTTPRQTEGLAGAALHGVLSAGGTITVVPLENRAASANSMVRWTDATTLRDGATRIAAWVGFRTGLASPLVRTRVRVSVRSNGATKPTLNEYLAAALGVRRVEVSVAFGSARPNQKPIVRIHADDGSTLGFAKVGWNDLTRQLVDTEAAFLASPAARALRTVRVPRLLHTGEWNDRRIVVASALSGPPRVRPVRPPGPAVVREVAARGAGSLAEAALATSPYRRTLDARLGELHGSAAAVARDAASVVDDGWSATRLAWGAWHGDWVPWNMRTTDDAVIVWDWERTAHDVPLGFDLLHYHFHKTLAATSNTPAIASLVDATSAAATALGDLGVRSNATPAVALLYALEMHLRFAATTGEPGESVAWLDGLLAAAIRHFGAR